VRLKTRLLIAVAAVAGMGAFASYALADSPHFINASASIDSSTGNLVCTFKEAGLGQVPTADVTCSASATVVYQCFNNGGNHPKAGNKETINADVSGSGTFPVRNGQTTGSISVAPPGPGDFSCPSGQTLFLQSVEYDNVVISGQGASASVGDVGPVTLHVAV
jgi:hypothetical protein